MDSIMENVPRTADVPPPAPKKAIKGKRTGRPRKPAEEKLVPYGLHLAPDKKEKLFLVKDSEGVSVREWIECQIECAYVQHKQAGTLKSPESPPTAET
jgi:hypothetical protein